MGERIFRDYGDSGKTSDPIPKGKHRVETTIGDFVCVVEKHPTCNWTDKRTIMSKEQYKKDFKEKDRIK